MARVSKQIRRKENRAALAQAHHVLDFLKICASRLPGIDELAETGVSLSEFESPDFSCLACPALLTCMVSGMPMRTDLSKGIPNDDAGDQAA